VTGSRKSASADRVGYFNEMTPHASQPIEGINLSEQRFEESDILAGDLGVVGDEGKSSGRAQNGDCFNWRFVEQGKCML
jgi:hypothetical protein